LPKLNLNTSKCVIYSSKHSNCDLCKNICKTNAIEIEQNRISIIYNSCTECGGCVGVCPNEALSLNNFNVTEFFIKFLKEKDEVISCNKNLPCIAILNVEHLIALKIQRDFILDIGYCDECEELLFNKIKSDVDEANYALSFFNKNEIKVQELKYQPENSENNKDDRRSFLSHFSLKGAIETKVKFQEELINSSNEKNLIDIDNSHKKREKTIPNKRKILYTSIKSLNKVNEYNYLNESKISFTSNKLIDKSCNNCSICYRICPTGALNSDKKKSMILFDLLLCIKCNLCSDVCESDSISLVPIYSKEFFEPKNRILIEFNIKRCDECNSFFTYSGGEMLCNRCKIEEEEALLLWKLK